MKNIELLEKELNQLGASWNLFGKVDTMKYLLKKIKEEFNQLNIEIMSKENVEYKGFRFEYDLNYTPAEKQTHDYPGCGEEFEITGITLNGVDASDLLEDQIDEFIDYVIDELKNQIY